MADQNEEVVNSADSTAERFGDLINNGKNKTKVVCELCNSEILKPEKAEYIEKQCQLPLMKSKKPPTAGDSVEYQELSDFWIVHDMFDFENMGFTNQVGTIKYLACADCEVGPIGLMDLQNKKDIFVAIERVKHIP